MKKKLFFMLIFVSTVLIAFPQNQKDAKDERKELKGQIKENATRSARKEAKKMQKDGWVVTAGALPLDKQLDEAWMKQYEKDDIGYPKYIVANGNAIGTNYSAAKNQALNLAKVELAGLIATQVAGLAENSVANQDLSKEEAASVVKTVEASKNIIAQEIGRVIPLLEVYKELKNKNVEVQVRIAYNVAMAAEAMRAKIVKKLEDETAITHEKLEKMMGGFSNIKNNSTVSDKTEE
jgi:hypothetical protein